MWAGCSIWGGGSYVIKVVYGTGAVAQTTIGGLPAPDASFTDPVVAYVGSFDGGLIPDVVLLINGSMFVFDGGGGTFAPSPQLGFVPISAEYTTLVVQDTNGDGLDDLEGVLPDGTRDLYEGTSAGLGGGAPMMGMPTADGLDGKFLAMVSLGDPQLATPVNDLTTLEIIVDSAAQPNLNVQVFDGDEGYSLWDTGDPMGAVTCYDLYGSSDGAFVDTLLLTRTGAELADGQWATLYEGPNLGQPDGDGYYYYLVDVRLAASGDCSDDTGAFSSPFVNGLKVRANGFLFAYSQDLAFIGYDVVGDFALPFTAPDVGTRDTTYDGQFQLFSFVTTAGQEIIFRDADADRNPDADPGTSPRGPLDVQADGFALGASSTIEYTVYDPNGDAVLYNDNPSGNNDGVTTFDTEELIVPTNGLTGFYAWNWTGVYVHNSVRIWVPVGSPIAYPMMTQRAILPPVSSAVPVETWLSLSVAPELLPVTMGLGSGSDFSVTSQQLAMAILRREVAALGGAGPGKASLCHGAIAQNLITVARPAAASHLAHNDDGDAPAVSAAFSAELLAAKLNLAATGARGEPLAEAHIYGTDLLVGEALDAADAAFVQGDEICSLDEQALASLQRLTLVLRAINLGELTYIVGSPRPLAASARLASPLLAPSPSNPTPAPAQCFPF